MTPLEIEVELREEIGWQRAQEVVDQIGRELLASLPATQTITTTDLVNRLYPLQAVRGDGKARQRLFKILQQVYHGEPVVLKDCRMRGPEKRFRGRKVHGWLFHAPRATPKPMRLICCPNCQHEWEIEI